MSAAPRVIAGSRGIPTTVIVRQTLIDDLADEITALQQEAIDLAELALPLARQLRLVASAVGPTSIAMADNLVKLLERQIRRHGPRRAA